MNSLPIQSVAGGSGSATGANVITTSAGFPTPTAEGNCLLCVVWATSSDSVSVANPTIQTPVTPGFTWTLLALSSNGFGTFAPAVGVFYIVNASVMGVDVLTTVTVLKGGSGANAAQKAEFSLYELPGIAPSAIVDKFSPPAGAGNAPGLKSSSITTTTNDLLLFAYTGQAGTDLTQAAGYTLGVNAAVAMVGQVQFKADVPAGLQPNTDNFSDVNARWAGVWAALKSPTAQAPMVSGIAPSRGPTTGGTFCTITGTGFNGSVVAFGGSPATGAVVVSPTSITCYTPGHSAGLVDVVVTNADSQIGTLENGFLYFDFAPGGGGSSGVVVGSTSISGGSSNASPAIFTYRRLDANHDPIRGHGQADFLVNIDAVAQAIQTRLLLFQAEWWADRADGLPLWQKILGVGGSGKNPQAVNLLITERILGTPYVTGIRNLSSSFNPNTRAFQFSCTVDTQFGAVALTNAQSPTPAASLSFPVS